MNDASTASVFHRQIKQKMDHTPDDCLPGLTFIHTKPLRIIIVFCGSLDFWEPTDVSISPTEKNNLRCNIEDRI